MTLIGQHARRSDYVSENSAEGVNNGNVDKIRWCQKVQVSNIFFGFQKNKNMEPSEIKFLRAPCFLFLKNLKKILRT